MSSHALAWDKIADNTYAIYGEKILSSSENFENKSELVYNSEYESFGFSMITINGTRTSIPYGIFRFKSCAMDTTGAVANHTLRDPATDDQMYLIFNKCNRPAYLRIWDTTNNFSLYKFESVGPIEDR